MKNFRNKGIDFIGAKVERLDLDIDLIHVKPLIVHPWMSVAIVCTKKCHLFVLGGVCIVTSKVNDGQLMCKSYHK